MFPLEELFGLLEAEVKSFLTVDNVDSTFIQATGVHIIKQVGASHFWCEINDIMVLV